MEEDDPACRPVVEHLNIHIRYHPDRINADGNQVPRIATAQAFEVPHLATRLTAVFVAEKLELPPKTSLVLTAGAFKSVLGVFYLTRRRSAVFEVPKTMLPWVYQPVTERRRR
jgi:hypothetical protein